MKLCAFCLFIFFSLSTQALEININVTGVVVSPPPCKINNDVDIAVDFGKVSLNSLDDINSNKNTKIIDLSISCDSSVTSNIALSLSADKAMFNPDFVKTSVEDLGIELFVDDIPLLPGKSVNLRKSKNAKFKAKLVKKKGSVLDEGDFTANSVLLVSYI
ncbi:putative fimbrial-like protein YfcQ [Photobacterium damselae subsp. damselae]|uniref:fimbrial protein n=1 Tax=Photobacterium damselae TaxID=38293 RepID=UPI00109BBE97|nr:fimbrial protein [Photobacterium damselae]TGZ35249.1 putative fimbrial-like protein YfcQ [Photobacterium damselae subsp. damselae]